MRKIDQYLKQAWDANDTIRIDNSVIFTISIKGTAFLALKLFGHVIALKDMASNTTQIRLCGHDTKTTRRRLANVLGADIYRYKGQTILNNKPMDQYNWHDLKANQYPNNFNIEQGDL